MDVSTLVFERYLTSRGIRRRAWSLARRYLINLLNDPTCSMSIHGKRLTLPLSHSLPDYLKQFQFYDQLPRRLSNYIHHTQGRLNCIDVGANVGDTIAAFYTQAADTFLAIEPNPAFHKHLVANWGWNKNVTVVSDICSSGSSERTFVIREKNGTASILCTETDNGTGMRRRRLDDIVNDHPFATTANVLKVDTDGHDFEVIAGSERTVSHNHPVVLFECDAFENVDYVEDVLKTLTLFRLNGYKHFLLYDNVGYLFGTYSLSDLSAFQNLLLFQLTSTFCYFDVLVMMDQDLFPFSKTEINYFVDKMANKSLQRTATTAAERQAVERVGSNDIHRGNSSGNAGGGVSP